MSDSARIRSQLDHPILDTDGHCLEVRPVMLDYVEAVGGPKMMERFRGPNEVNDHYRSPLWTASPDDRRDSWQRKPSFWGFPAENTMDRATAMIPGLLYERLDEFGIDFSVVYPTEGLKMPDIEDAELRQVVCRAYNTYVRDAYAPYADRITPVAIIPMHTPTEAIEELEYAVGVLGMKAAMFSGAQAVFRTIPKMERKYPEAAHLLTRPDYFGMDSAYDYDPVWAKAQELKVAVTFHTGQTGWASRQSLTSSMFNHIGTISTGSEPLCKALFLGGVTRRFPDVNFAFLEGGVAWACSLYSDALAHWEKRNVNAIGRLDPSKIDDGLIMELIAQYGDERLQAKSEDVHRVVVSDKSMPRPWSIDDFEPMKVETAEEFCGLFAPHFWFGVEADDPKNAWAFNTETNPFGAKMQSMLGSDIGHWDVPDMNEVLEEAWESVEGGLISPSDFRDMTFANGVRLHGGMNPEFFAGTKIEAEAAAVLAAEDPEREGERSIQNTGD
jgi:predicted TIM-barrel fold metal-dependent hydrolase